MSSDQYPCSDDLHSLVEEMQISAIGIASAGEIPSNVLDTYIKWIDANKHGEMDYMAKYETLRRNPQELLPGAQSVIVAAFNYHTPLKFPENNPQWASYALGDDYHDVVRYRLSQLASFIQEKWGGETRVC